MVLSSGSLGQQDFLRTMSATGAQLQGPFQNLQSDWVWQAYFQGPPDIGQEGLEPVQEPFQGPQPGLSSACLSPDAQRVWLPRSLGIPRCWWPDQAKQGCKRVLGVGGDGAVSSSVAWKTVSESAAWVGACVLKTAILGFELHQGFSLLLGSPSSHKGSFVLGWIPNCCCWRENASKDVPDISPPAGLSLSHPVGYISCWL